MFHILYNIFILPIENIVELIFYFANNYFESQPVVSILCVSIVVNLLVLPLYKRAEAMQEEEREKQKKMDRWNKHIRKTFKGDERFMMQSAYYRIENYKPLYSVKGSLSLLFQIPFFIAAYHFLSNLELLNGASFLMIDDLGKPDGLIKLFSISVNVLPILMTVINILSGVIYTKGFSFKEKFQLYGMAAVFLILLYNSPSGLVLYWTFNNTFSLCKNIVMKLITLPKRMEKSETRIGRLCNSLTNIHDEKFCKKLFFTSAILIAVFMGLLIPSEVIKSAPVDFGESVLNSYLYLIANVFATYVGFCVLWLGIFYLISTKLVKVAFSYLLTISALAGMVTYYLFSQSFGLMTTNLLYHEAPQWTRKTVFFNALVVLEVAVVVIICSYWFKDAMTGFLQILIITTVVLSVVNMVDTHKVLKENGYYEIERKDEYEPLFSLSTQGKNIVVLMLDRSVGIYVPYMFNEKPELAKVYKDFIYYPNTLSYGAHTNFASPALFGGYEYTPSKINERDTESLRDKQNEAISVVPAIFDAEDYHVTVCDAPYANYKDIPDMSIYDKYENVDAYVTNGMYKNMMYNLYDGGVQQRNFFYYSFFRTVPCFAQKFVYDDGNYLGRETTTYVTPACLDAYTVLYGLKELTQIEQSDENTLLMLYNYTTHEQTVLKTPEYEMSHFPDEVPYSKERQDEYVLNGVRLNMDNSNNVAQYHVNMASFLMLGDWFEYLKEQGVYDNTRIIIASDHGWDSHQIDSMVFSDELDAEFFNPVLMVKDFAGEDNYNNDDLEKLNNTDVYLSDKFMTNADVPTIIFKGIIDHPVNPFTGKEINNLDKYNGKQRVTTSVNWAVEGVTENVFDTSDGQWYDVHGSIFKEKNWELVK